MNQKPRARMIDYRRYDGIFLNERLISDCLLSYKKEKSQLEEQLQDITRNLEESKNYISQLQVQTKKEKRDRAKYYQEIETFSCGI